jgi:tetratricopeptide (TPR) repeat protein
VLLALAPGRLPAEALPEVRVFQSHGPVRRLEAPVAPCGNDFPRRPGGDAVQRAAAAEPTTGSRISPTAAARAEEEVRRGFGLADRQAVFAAREAFRTALRHIAEALDALEGTTLHGRALAEGLRALEESDEFLASRHAAEADLDVAAVAGTHRTPVVRQAQGEVLSPREARSRYYTYAQEQLATAVADEPAGSLALYALGKLHGGMAAAQADVFVAARSKALVFHQSALLADPYNPLAANELAVLLAKAGRLPEARDWLRTSVMIRPDATVWRNLAAIHQHLGESQHAELAEREAVLCEADPPAAGGTVVSERASEGRPAIEWVDPTALAEGGPAPASPRPIARPAPAAATAERPAPEEKTGLSRWLPWK